MGKSITQINHTPASGSARTSNQLKSHGTPFRRVWVRRTGGSPTTILVGSTDIVDDLKSGIMAKFPNSLARNFDPADIRIHLRAQHADKPQTSRRMKQSKATSGGRMKNESSDDTLKQPIMFNQSSLTLLEPDENVWEILDEYFPGSMSMSDAFLIDVDERRFPYNIRGSNERPLEREDVEDPTLATLERLRSPSQSWTGETRLSPLDANNQVYHHKPHQPVPIRQNAFGKYRSASPNSHGTRSPPLHLPNQHKRSTSNPPQSPIPSIGQQTRNSVSQAVLLLPKNFSLGEQHTLKKFSDGETADSKSLSGEVPKGDYNSTATIADSASDISSPNFDIPPEEVQESRNIERQSKSLIKEGLSSSPVAQKLTLPAPTTRVNQDSSKHSKETKDLKEPPSKSSNMKSKETTINTSTFEKVLPLISVLVVEDNSINQAILGAFLRKHKIHYQIAKNGQEAVDKWRKGGFHLVLMDIQLPVKSGIEATKEIRHLEKVNRIGVFAQHELMKSSHNSQLKIKEEEKLNLITFRSPVIIVALTASSNSSIDKKNALTAGCNDFLTKPVNLVWLQNKITEWGCMQALIDFDAWRVKGSPQNNSVATRSTSGESKTNDVRGKKPLGAL